MRAASERHYFSALQFAMSAVWVQKAPEQRETQAAGRCQRAGEWSGPMMWVELCQHLPQQEAGEERPWATHRAHQQAPTLLFSRERMWRGGAERLVTTAGRRSSENSICPFFPPHGKEDSKPA